MKEEECNRKNRDEKTLRFLHSRARRNSVIRTLTPVDGVPPAY